MNRKITSEAKPRWNDGASPHKQMNRIMSLLLALIAATFFIAATLSSNVEAEVPHTVEQIRWTFDPRQDPLDVQIVRSGTKARLHSATSRTTSARSKASSPYGGVLCVPQEASVPALLHIHGGGTHTDFLRKSPSTPSGLCLPVGELGRARDGECPAGHPNTDLGAVDPTQQNVPGYFNLLPGEKYLDPVGVAQEQQLVLAHHRLPPDVSGQQPEVDPQTRRVRAFDGGNLTVYVAGSDSRVKVAAPSVGGSGFRTVPRPLLPEERKQMPKGDVNLFAATLGFESYSPHVGTPLCLARGDE